MIVSAFGRYLSQTAHDHEIRHQWQAVRLAEVTGGRCVYATSRPGETIVP